MNISKYQQLAARTLIDKPDRTIPPRELAFALVAIGLAIQAGAIAEKVKKAVFHQHGLNEREVLAMVRSLGTYCVLIYDDLPGTEKEASILTDDEIMLLWNLIGLFGEVAEISHLITISLGDLGALNDDALADELGDLEWYANAVATKRDIDMAGVLSANIEKLMKRYPDGYTAEDSQNRADLQKAD